ncbi:MAG: hypothetical protein AAF329_18360 [Cyanobacteria bacterium P01_A01_bin.17]
MNSLNGSKSTTKPAAWLFLKQAVTILFSTPPALSVFSTLNYHWEFGQSIRRVLRGYERFVEILWDNLLGLIGIQLNIRPEVGVFILFLASPVILAYSVILIKQERKVWNHFRHWKSENESTEGTEQQSNKLSQEQRRKRQEVRARLRADVISERNSKTEVQTVVQKYWNRSSLISVLLIFVIFGLWIYPAFFTAVVLSVAMVVSFIGAFYAPVVWGAWAIYPSALEGAEFNVAVAYPLAACVLAFLFFIAVPEWWTLFPRDVSGGAIISLFIALLLVFALFSFYAVSSVLEIRTPAYAMIWVFGMLFFSWLADHVLPWPDLQYRLDEWLDSQGL